MISAVCRHYRWRHDFWHRMGVKEFWAWVHQANRENEGTKPSPHSWRGTDQDEGWANMRAKRDRLMGKTV